MAINQQIDTEIAEATPVLTVTDSALTMLKNLLQQRNIPNYVLRVFISGGGCSGLQYGMGFEPEPDSLDQVVDCDGVRLVVDPTSLMYLSGATIDFVDSLMGGGFRIENPNAVSSCGCGSSFKTKDSADATDTAGCSCSH